MSASFILFFSSSIGKLDWRIVLAHMKNFRAHIVESLHSSSRSDSSHRSCRPTSPTFTFAGAISRHASLQASWTKYDQINDVWSLKTQRCLVLELFPNEG